jgi:hypothetical protein
LTVFVAVSDESGGADQGAGGFLYGGFLAPEDYWRDWFTPAWDERVLARRPPMPPLPYLHMTEIRSPRWREEHDLTDREAEQRTDEAFRVINSMGMLHPITSEANATHFRDAFAAIQIGGEGTRAGAMEPDYLCFLMYALHALGFVTREYPDAERVDFLVERTDKAITGRFHGFHQRLKAVLEQLGLQSHARLVGSLDHVGKGHVPAQAADVLCWHGRRLLEGALSRTNERRYATLARLIGMRHKWSRDEVAAFAHAAEQAHATP